MIFISNSLLRSFFESAMRIEQSLFSRSVILVFPSDPMHQLLIHGFGAGVLILGATLIYSAKEPQKLISFVFLDGLGRLVFGCMMVYYVRVYDLMNTILLFGIVELMFACLYLWGSRVISRNKREMAVTF